LAVLKGWPDGYMLDMDPRREDPLFYYRTEDWSEAIGFDREDHPAADAALWCKE
jgi:hypothetical protein